MKVDVYTQQGNKLKTTLALDEKIFGLEPNQELLAQYVRVYRANQRQGTARAKTRAEVSGGGRKPWRQKGTGRARHGSTRSPLWVGGGKAHGPKPRDWSLKMPSKMKKAALAAALSAKAQSEDLLLLNKLELKEIKTNAMAKILSNLPVKNKILLVLGSLDKKIILAARNLPGVKTVPAADVNAYDVLNTKTLLLTKEALQVLKERLA
jgi:large subunit ribosomal protein L4